MPLHRRALFVASCLCLPISADAEAIWTLITPEEAQRGRVPPNGQEPIILGFASGPGIEMDQPDISKPVSAPVNLRVRFVAQPGASVNLSTFKATYGWLDIDITKRILEHATLSKSGLSADNASIPPGDHRVTLSISDTTGQGGSRLFKFTVTS
jgi:hypothetical protein